MTGAVTGTVLSLWKITGPLMRLRCTVFVCGVLCLHKNRTQFSVLCESNSSVERPVRPQRTDTARLRQIRWSNAAVWCTTAQATLSTGTRASQGLSPIIERHHHNGDSKLFTEIYAITTVSVTHPYTIAAHLALLKSSTYDRFQVAVLRIGYTDTELLDF